jgi:RNA polymerase sigma-70 factor (ECF subfamily)
MTNEAAQAAERAARESYGRLVAFLAARTRDLAAAEDALADAFASALRVWPQTGAPDNPAAWLYAVAQRRLIDQARRARTADAYATERAALSSDTEEVALAIPDRRLGLMFACAHPAIDAAARTPLMLQTVLGVAADRIAAAFLVEPAAMGQRLVRAKRKIKEAGIPFEIPGPDEWDERLGAVLDAIYAAYADGWIDAADADADRVELVSEALWLSEILTALAAHHPEVLGLRALLLHLHARRAARRDANGDDVPLDAQDTSLWDVDAIRDAERLLFQAGRLGRVGRFQLEAAIQSAHASRAFGRRVDWAAIVQLYEGLVTITGGSPVVALNRVAALAHRDGPAAALPALEPLAEFLQGYQPYWALRARLLEEVGDAEGARAAYAEAIARAPNGAAKSFLRKRAARFSANVERDEPAAS